MTAWRTSLARKLYLSALVACLASFPISALRSAEPAGSHAQGVPLEPGTTTVSIKQAELKAFLEGLLGGLMAERHIPGAVVVVVKNGEIFLARGYGHADLATKRPVDPESTLFRVASISKLFTATAVMQLVEQGKLDLNADVNGYLERVEIEPRFGNPVTVAHLLTHTAGFDDEFLGSTQPLEEAPISLEKYLAARMPPRVLPPGELISYSNHGLALAGHVVERVSGEPFSTYVERHILDPLGMRNSGFGLPVPVPPELAVPYDYKDGTYAPMGYDRMHMSPAGDFYTSGTDIARFMIAHLQKGRFGNVRILAPATAELMQSRQFTHHPLLDGWCYGFVERTFNGVRTVGHGGDWRGFGSMLVLVPSADLGIFVSTTRNHDVRFFDSFLKSFFDHYFPRSVPLPRLRAPADFASRASRFTGSYVPNRHMRNSLLKLGLFLSEVQVRATDDGALMVHPPAGWRDPFRLVEVEPRLFRNDDNGHFVAFRGGPDGKISHMFVDALAFDKVPWHGSPRLHAILAAACVVVFFLTPLGWILGGLVRRLPGTSPSPVPLGARLLVGSVSLLNGIFLAAIAAALANVSPYVLFSGLPGWLLALCVVPLLTLPLSVSVPYFLVRSFTDRWPPLHRLHFVVLTTSVALFASLLFFWNLAGSPLWF